ncbi:hypothetical protein [Clostridium sp.]|uniref:hypothetical protein n=1 Tax=Clostridium sp. TaxID=1506 RepID=UPI003217685E
MTINIASINAVLADKDASLFRHSYNTSKSAVRGLTMGMSASYMQDNITIYEKRPYLRYSLFTLY